MSEPGLKCENNAANFKQIYALKLFIAFKMAYSCCFSFVGNLDFPEFLQKKFYNINYIVYFELLKYFVGKLETCLKSKLNVFKLKQNKRIIVI